MGELKCRGESCRERLIENYNLIPRAYTKLLSGQEKFSCTGDIITESYFTFEYTSKTDSTDAGSLICGSHAAKHFFDLLNVSPPPIFNPLKNLGTITSSMADSKSTSISQKWNPVALELHNAINLLIICWNKPISGKLAKYKGDLEKFPSNEPFTSKIKHVNNILGYDAKKRSLTKMVDELRKKNPTLHHYTFYEIDKILTKNKIDSNF